MFMLCWFYCVPFLKLFYFSTGPLLFLFALFIRRRGIYRRHESLVKISYIFMFLSLVKIFLFDVRSAGRDLLCSGALLLPCSEQGWLALQGISFALLMTGTYLIGREAKRPSLDIYATSPKLGPEQISGWAGLGMTMVVLMIIWQLAPWFCYLVIGHMPDIFVVIPWPPVALATLVVLLIGLWRLEACPAFFPRENGAAGSRSKGAWLPRDTLWLAIFLYAITLALTYVAQDVLKQG